MGRRRRKLVSIRKPRVRLTPKGLRVTRPTARIGRAVGVNISSRGIRPSIRTGRRRASNSGCGRRLGCGSSVLVVVAVLILAALACDTTESGETPERQKMTVPAKADTPTSKPTSSPTSEPRTEATEGSTEAQATDSASSDTAAVEPTKLPTSTVPPTHTCTPSAKCFASTGVNLRAGPGTNYDKVGGLKEGEGLELLGKTADGAWYSVKLASGATAWVSAAYVTTDWDLSALATVAASDIPTPPPATNTPKPAPTSTPVPKPTAAPQPVCDCGGDYYNCSSFGSWNSAQACYNYCKSVGRGDIHRLDGDNDGTACESLR